MSDHDAGPELPGEPAPATPPPSSSGPPEPFLPPAMSPPMSPPPEFASNYPRGPQSGFAYVRPPGVYWDSIGTAVGMVFGHWGIYATASFIGFCILGLAYVPFLLMIIPTAIATASTGARHVGAEPLLMVGPQILLQFVFAFVLLCFVSLGLKHAQGAVPEVADFFIPFRTFGKACLAALLISVPAMIFQVISALAQLFLGSAQWIGLIFVGFVGVVAVLAYLALYGPLMISGAASLYMEISPLECFRRAMSMLGWNVLMLSLLTFVAGFLSGLGFMACCVGVLISYPILPNVIALHTLYCFPPSSAGQSNQAEAGMSIG